jgi:hypothetical protein
MPDACPAGPGAACACRLLVALCCLPRTSLPQFAQKCTTNTHAQRSEGPAVYEDHYQRIDNLHAVLLARGQGGHLTSAFSVVNEVEASLKADGLLGPLEYLRVNAARGALHRRLLRAALVSARGALDATQYPPVKYGAELAAAREGHSMRRDFPKKTSNFIA